MCLLPRAWKVVVMESNHRPRKRANVLTFEGLEGDGGGEQPPPLKKSKRTRFRWPVEGGGDGEQPPPSKTSKCARFRGLGRWWKVVVVENSHRPQKRARFQWPVEGGGGGTITALKNEQTCSFPRGWKGVISIFT